MATTESSLSPPPPPASGFGLPRLPSLPMGMLTSLNPFAGSETKESTATITDSTFFKRPIFGAILSKPTPPASADGRPTHQRNDSLAVMFAEPLVVDSDDASREGSVLDDARKHKRNRNKPKTAYSICHPPPASLTRHKLHRRPRSLLQLHRLSANERPVPAYEVIPSANFSARLTKSIIKTYKTKHGLCYNDMVILRAEKYYTAGDQEEEQDSQDIVALICRGRSSDSAAACGKAKICMSNGEDWEASPRTSGGYEFTTTDGHGLGITVRWVPKKSKDGKSKKRFNFSIIASGTRRHPVIATLSDTRLDVFDTYKVPDPAVSTPLSTPVQTDGFLAQAMEDEDAPANDECVTDERLRSIISVTAIHVAFKEGWSPYFKEDDKDAASKVGASPQKDAMTTPVSTPPGSPMQKGIDKRGSIRSVGSGILRRSSILSRTDRNSTTSIDSISTGADTTSVAKTGRARSDSASTVLVHRAASNRRRNNHGATWRPDLLSVQNSVPETSREDLTRPAAASPRLSTISSNVASSSPKVSRKASVAETEEDSAEDEASPVGENDDDKRESSAASDAVHEPDASQPSKKSFASRKSSRWRRIFCIS